jgi:uncharacterized protein YdeI (YjbR/CyaY-like superfamily)
VASVRPRDRAAWRAWLAKHHATTTDVTVEFAKKSAPKPTVTYADAVEEALCFGWIDGLKKRIDEHYYSHRFTPRKPGSIWSASNHERVARLVAAGLMHASGIAVIEAAKADGSWTAHVDAERANVMPAELVSALKPVALLRAFEALAPGRQRELRRWIEAAKRPETRVRRIAEIVERLRGR